MGKSKTSFPLSRSEAIELYFMEHRAKLIDLAAFLDRIERAPGEPGQRDDFRMIAFREAIEILSDDKPHRARRVLELFSDPTTEPIPKAPMKGALGAYSGGAYSGGKPS